METAKKVANYFIASVSETGYLPLVDFKAPAQPVLYDSTAGAIAACGLIEIAKYVANETEQALYLNAARAGKNALAICTISDNPFTGEGLSAEERQNTFTKMMEIALEIA